MAAAHLRVILLGGGHIASSSDASDRFRPGPAGPAGRRQPAPTLARDLGAQERDPRRLEQRRKQVGLGKGTEGYLRYAAAVPRRARDPRLAHEAPAGGLPHPRTPSATQQCSKRSWDGQVRKWRRLLHAWDPPPESESGKSDKRPRCDTGGAPPLGGGGGGGRGGARRPPPPPRKRPRRGGGEEGSSPSPAGSGSDPDSFSGLEGLGVSDLGASGGGKAGRGGPQQTTTIALFTGGPGDSDDGLGGG